MGLFEALGDEEMRAVGSMTRVRLVGGSFSSLSCPLCCCCWCCCCITDEKTVLCCLDGDALRGVETTTFSAHEVISSRVLFLGVTSSVVAPDRQRGGGTGKRASVSTSEGADEMGEEEMWSRILLARVCVWMWGCVDVGMWGCVGVTCVEVSVGLIFFRAERKKGAGQDEGRRTSIMDRETGK